MHRTYAKYCRPPFTFSHAHTYKHTHTHFAYTIQISQTQINNAGAVITPRGTVTQRKRKRMTKKQRRIKKTTCVSSESQAREAHVLFQGSAWGEKGDLGCLCLSVLHVLCILFFVMISTIAEGGMLASRVPKEGWDQWIAEVQLSSNLQWSPSPLTHRWAYVERTALPCYDHYSYLLLPRRI